MYKLKEAFMKRTMATLLTVAMLLGMIPTGIVAIFGVTNAKAGDSQEKASALHGAVSTLTDGLKVNAEGDIYTVTNEDKVVLDWVEANPSAGLYINAWRGGAKVSVPTGADIDSATLNAKKHNETGFTSGIALSDRVSLGSDGKQYVELWVDVPNAALLLQKEQLVNEYRFDWDGDGVIDQTVKVALISNDLVLEGKPAFENNIVTLYYGTKSFKNGLVTDGFGTAGAGTYEYTVTDNDVVKSIDANGRITFANGKVGGLTVTVKRTDGAFAAMDCSASYVLNVIYDPAFVGVDVKVSAWYKGDAVINAPAGFEIGLSNALDGASFANSVSFSDLSEGDNQRTVYLKNAAGSISEGIVLDLSVDSEAPVLNATIGYSEPKNTYNGKAYYNDRAKVTVSVNDFLTEEFLPDERNIDKLVFCAGDKEIASFKNSVFHIDPEVIDPSSYGFRYEGTKVVFDFWINTEVENTIKCYAVDAAGNTSAAVVNNTVIVVDKTKPVIDASAFYGNVNLVSNKYYGGAGTSFSFTVTDKNFLKDLIKVSLKKDGVSVSAPTVNWSANVGTVTLDADGDYLITIEGTDLAGNAFRTFTSNGICIDSTKPAINTDDFYNNTTKVGNTYYSNSAYTKFEFTVTEHNFNKASFSVSLEKNGASVSDSPAITWNSDGDVHKGYFVISAEGDYIITVKGKDILGNEASFTSSQVRIDRTKPVINTSDFYKNTTLINGSRYSNAKEVEFTFTVTEHNFDSSKFVVSLTKNGASAGTANVKWTSNGDVHTGKFTLTGDGAYVITVSGKDLATNEMVEFKSEEIRVDSNAPVINTTKFYENVDPINGVHCTNAAKTKFVFTVSEDNFVKSGFEISLKKDNVNIEFHPTIYWVTSGDDYVGSFYLEDEGDYIITVKGKDILGNEASFTSNEVRIDRTKPVINTEDFYANKNKFGNKYYSNAEKVEFTFTVTEHNFDGNKFEVSLRKNGVEVSLKPVISWTSNGDVHVGTFTLEAEGDYRITINGKDALDNTMVSFTSDEVRIDHTLPTINTNDFYYSNIKFINGEYYVQAADETIFKFSVTEHNFSPSLYTATVKKGGATDYVAKINWDYSNEKNGIYEGIITLKDEGDYKIVITGKDVAGNPMQTFTSDSVLCDDMPPVIDKTTYSYKNTTPINGIRYSNAEEVEFKFTVTEHSFDSNLFEVSLKKNGVLVSDNPGIKWDYNNKDKGVYVGTITLEVEGDYVITILGADILGNRTVSEPSDEIHIDHTLPSINTDDFYANLKVNGVEKLINNVYFSNQDSVAFTFTVTEHNFDSSKFVVSLTKNDGSVDTAEITWDDSNKENDIYVGTFILKDEGAYDITVSGEDLATNEMEEFKSEEIRIDRTAPDSLDVSYTGYVNQVGYNYYFNGDFLVTLFAYDDIACIEYFKISIDSEGFDAATTIALPKNLEIDRNGNVVSGSLGSLKIIEREDLSDEECLDPSVDAEVIILVPESLVGRVSFTAVDYCANESAEKTDDEVVIADSTAPKFEAKFDEWQNEEKGVLPSESNVYYNVSPTVTLIFTEINFFKEDVVWTVYYNGEAMEAPVELVWDEENSDATQGIYIATVNFKLPELAADGDIYSFSVEYSDRSKNQMEIFRSPTIYVDGRAPEIVVEGTVIDGINGGDNHFEEGKTGISIAISDENLDKDKTTATLTMHYFNGETYEYKSETVEFAYGESVTDGVVELTFDIEDLGTDGYYTLVISTVDKATNDSADEQEFYINRNGSVFTITATGADGEEVYGKYYNADAGVKVVITEYSVSGHKDGDDAFTLTVFNGSSATTLKAGSTMAVVTTEYVEGKAMYVYTYTFGANCEGVAENCFASDGSYGVELLTKDTGNTNVYAGENAEGEALKFTVDTIAPSIVINVNDNQRIDATEKVVTFRISDSNINLDTLKATFNGKDITAQLEQIGNGEYSFTMKTGLNHRISIEVEDYAGNETKLDVKNITVSTNFFVLWYANTALFWGTIGGALALIAAVIAFVVFKKKKKASK